jgi:hypothetical protein
MFKAEVFKMNWLVSMVLMCRTAKQQGLLDDPVRKTSPIYKLDLQVRNQLLYVRGRLANAPVSDEKQTPINHPEEQSNFETDFKTLPSEGRT